MATFMRKLFMLTCTLLFFASACSVVSRIRSGQGDEESRGTPMVSGVDPSIAPLLTDEQIACTSFVAPEGDDQNIGSEFEPWGSFQHAGELGEPGDTVCFRGGSYTLEDPIRLSSSGSPESPITFIAYPGERPILDGRREIGGLLILDQGTSNLRISGFTLQNFTDWGVDLEGDNRNVRLDHLGVDGGEAGVHFTFGSDELAPPEGGPVEHITLEDSVISNSEFTAVDCTPGP